MKNLPTIADKAELLDSLCRSTGVKRLTLYGSALRADFDPVHSDLDFIVEFNPMSAVERAEAYFSLLEGLEKIFARPVDLGERAAIRNPYLLQSLHQTEQEVFHAA